MIFLAWLRCPWISDRAAEPAEPVPFSDTLTSNSPDCRLLSSAIRRVLVAASCPCPVLLRRLAARPARKCMQSDAAAVVPPPRRGKVAGREGCDVDRDRHRDLRTQLTTSARLVRGCWPPRTSRAGDLTAADPPGRRRCRGERRPGPSCRARLPPCFPRTLGTVSRQPGSPGAREPARRHPQRPTIAAARTTAMPLRGRCLPGRLPPPGNPAGPMWQRAGSGRPVVTTGRLAPGLSRDSSDPRGGCAGRGGAGPGPGPADVARRSGDTCRPAPHAAIVHQSVRLPSNDVLCKVWIPTAVTIANITVAAPPITPSA
jgi:hypothetical protein